MKLITEPSKERFYVYFLCDPRKPGEYRFGQYSLSNEPYYCGKGLVSRIRSGKNRFVQSKTKSIISDGFEPIYSYVGEFDEDTAFALEEYFVDIIGRKDLGTGPLLNLINGGDGSGMGRSHGPLSRQKMSETRSGKSWEETQGEESAVNRKELYSSRMKTNNINKNGHSNHKGVPKKYKNGHHQSKKIVVYGIEYESITAATKATGLSRMMAIRESKK